MGNMDIRDFVAGSTLYVPVHVPGALLWTGDSHAGQGNGEVNLTAIETAYKEFNITVEVIKGSRTIARALPSMVSPGHDFEHEIIGNVTATIMSEIAA
jgi:acetamidase/formamidase